MKYIIRSIILIFAINLIGCSEPTTPIIKEKVSDPGGLLIYFHDYFKYSINSWKQELGVDFHVVVLEDKVGDIVKHGQKIFQDRAVGKNAKTGGILILLSPKSNEARIIVSHNLEAVFTDAIVGSIVKSQLAPYASYNLAGMAVMDTMHFLKDHLLAQVASDAFELDSYYREQPGNKTILGFYSGGGGSTARIPTINFNSNWRQKPTENNLASYLPSNKPSESANAYASSLRDLVGYPDLPLYTEATKIMKGAYPFAPYEAYQAYLRIEKSRPLTIVYKEDRAVAVSKTPAQGFMPIMMIQVDGKWLIDYSAMIKNMFFDGDGNYYQKNSNNPYTFALTKTNGTGSFDISPMELPQSQNLAKVISDLKRQQNDGMNVFLIAELLFRNAFSAMESLEYYEKTVEIEPNNEFFRKKLVERYRYLGMETIALKHAEKVDEYKKRFDSPLKVKFTPAQPKIHLGKPTKVGEIVVYDHSNFGVEITNKHFSPMNIKKVIFTSIGDKETSGLGDIINYWKWAGAKTLNEGQSISFNKVWGFTRDTPNNKMTYKFKFVYTLGNSSKEHVLIKELILKPDYS